MGGLLLGVNTLYRIFCFFKLFPTVGKGLTAMAGQFITECLYAGPVRGIDFHCNQPLFVSGGDDYKIKVGGSCVCRKRGRLWRVAGSKMEV